MGIYVGVNGSPKSVSGVYIGVNGEVKPASGVYIGSGGGVKLVFPDLIKEVVITSSCTYTVPTGANYVDAFLVGGGGYGISGSCYNPSSSSLSSSRYCHGGNGGFGGKTITTERIPVNSGDQLSITIGTGGIASSSTIASNTILKYGDDEYSATGATTSSGGSGYGKYGGYYKISSTSNTTIHKARPGASNGAASNTWLYSSNSHTTSLTTSSSGCQLSTTRAFKESDGTLYSGGGGGGEGGSFAVGTEYLGGAGGDGGGGSGDSISDTGERISGTSGSANTGGGGGGGLGKGSYSISSNSTGSGYLYEGHDGGSGIAILRFYK